MADLRVERPADDDFDIDQIVIEVADTWGQAETPEEEQAALNAMTDAQRLLLAYRCLWDQWASGDLSTFFYNSTGSLWEDALEATRVMGLPEYEILREGIALFQDGRPSKVTAERRAWLEEVQAAGKLEELDEKFAELDARYYAVPDRTDLIHQFIRDHADDLFRPSAG